jgi:hypothetical protein
MSGDIEFYLVSVFKDIKEKSCILFFHYAKTLLLMDLGIGT